MNERVEKFARECGAWNQVYGNRNFMIDEHFDVEKFAELIVRECGEIAYDHTPNSEECEYQWLIHNKIREHFGVEE
jgi:hypothetical protein